MPLNDLNRNSISFKKSVGKAHTQQGFSFTEEGITSNVPISFSTVFGEIINPNPSGLSSIGDSDGIVEKLRFEVEIIPDTQVGTNQSQGYRLVLPTGSTIFSEFSGLTGSITASTYLHLGLGKLQLVPSLYGSLRNDGSTIYDPKLLQTDGVTEITKFDPINWIIDPYNGILFVQDPPSGYDISASRPGFVEAYLYVGDYLDTVLDEFTGGTGSNATGERIEKEIIQSSHGFVVGDVVGYSGSTYNKVVSTQNGGEPLGIIGEVIDSNTFKIVYAGFIDGISGVTDASSLSISANTVYFLSTSVDGKLDPNPPNGIDDIIKPILYTLDNNSANVFQYRGDIIQSGSTGIGGKLPVFTTTDPTVNITSDTDSAYISTSTSTYNLPSSPDVGTQITISDGSGNASTSNITINGNGNNILDDTFAIINTDYGSITFLYNGVFWTVKEFVN